jgi:hypothetical protein
MLPVEMKETSERMTTAMSRRFQLFLIYDFGPLKRKPLETILSTHSAAKMMERERSMV